MEAPPVTLFKCYQVKNGVIDADASGGSYDNISAVTIACSVFQAMQDYSPSPRNAVTIHDDTGKVIAFVGKYIEAPVGEAPPPVLTSLVPDSAGDWNVEVHAHGTGFSAASRLVGGGVEATTTFVSETELSAVVPGIVAAGVYPVLVRNGAVDSNTLDFTAL